MAMHRELGISLPNRLVSFGFPARELVDLASAAEQSGVLGSVWVGDSLLAKPRLEALTLLAAVASRTSTVRLGTMCLASFVFRDPLLLAIQVASLDNLSDGRVVLGLCSGPGAKGGTGARAELELFGVASERRGEILEERLQRLRSLLGNSDLADRVLMAPVTPRPLQSRIPILIAATPPPSNEAIIDRLLSRVARIGDGWVCDAVAPRRLSGLWARLVELADATGRLDRMTEAIVHVPVVIDPSRRAAEEIARAFLAQHLGAPVDAARLPEAGAYGPPSLVVDHLSSLLEAGATTVVVRPLAPDPRAQLDLLVTQVGPQMSDRG
jgi:alkanesulfonate monooxygenase SsuD/methylene tetrahydromethanopterin reductase-like flavin-dependent oxidoreductase (luciferase family)